VNFGGWYSIAADRQSGKRKKKETFTKEARERKEQREKEKREGMK
jgi:hypothetical protein